MSCDVPSPPKSGEKVADRPDEGAFCDGSLPIHGFAKYQAVRTTPMVITMRRTSDRFILRASVAPSQPPNDAEISIGTASLQSTLPEITNTTTATPLISPARSVLSPLT